MAEHERKKERKKGKGMRQLSEQQVRELARSIISEAESATDISRGVRERKKRLLPPPASVMIF